MKSIFVSVLGVVFLLPAWASNPGEPLDPEPFILSDTPLFPEVRPESALLYLLRENGKKPRAADVYLDDTPLGYLPTGTYLATYVEPGVHLLWSWSYGLRYERIDFKAGRGYVLRWAYLPYQEEHIPVWSIDDIEAVRSQVVDLELAHVRATDASLAELPRWPRGHRKAYKQAARRRDTPIDVTLPAEFSKVFYRWKDPTCDELAGWFRARGKPGTLTVNARGVVFRDANGELEVPMGEIQRVHQDGRCLRIGTKQGDDYDFRAFYVPKGGDSTRIALSILEARASAGLPSAGESQD